MSNTNYDKGGATPSNQSETIKRLQWDLEEAHHLLAVRFNRIANLKTELETFKGYNVMNHDTMTKLDNTIFKLHAQLAEQTDKFVRAEQGFLHAKAECKTLKERLDAALVSRFCFFFAAASDYNIPLGNQRHWI